MGFTVSFVERRDPETSSIERLIRSVGQALAERGVQIRYDKVPYGNSMAGILANLFAKRPRKADIFHVTGHIHYYALLLPRKKTVLTMHDLRILGMRSGVRRFLIKKFFYDLPAKRLDFIVTGSDGAKRDLLRLTGCSEAKIRVIGHPLTLEITGHPKPFETAKPRILQIGTAENKNLLTLIRSLAGLTCTLIIIGRLDDRTCEALRVNEIDFENRFDLSDAEIRQEYLNCDIVTFCSTSEGFGLPIIEAQAMHIPVVTSNISPMSDVAGDGAILVDPFDPTSVRAGIVKVIENEDLRQKMVQYGMKNIERFSPDGIARQYEELYQEMLGENTLSLVNHGG